MMAVRERAVKAMAALERRVPSLGDFEGQSWSTWAERAGVTASDGKEARFHPYRLIMETIEEPVGVYSRGNGGQR